jgi:hypothetical protein
MSWWTPEHLPAGRAQAGDRHLKFHKTGDNLIWTGCGGRAVAIGSLGRRPQWPHAMEPQAFLRLQEGLVSQDRWIIDGGRADLSVRLARADTVIFLDLPRRTCMWRIVKRTGSLRSDYPPDVRESWRWMVVLIRWIWSYPKHKCPDMVAAIKEHAGHANLIWCRSASDVSLLMKSIGTV